jgi:hypothetical protein
MDEDDPVARTFVRAQGNLGGKGSGANFLRMSDGMFREEVFAGLCSKNSSLNARSCYRSAGQGPDLELLFPIFSASSMPSIVISRCVESLEPKHRSTRCLMRR